MNALDIEENRESEQEQGNPHCRIVAERLRGFRRSLNLTQTEFSSRLSISRKTLSELENAKKLPGGLLLHGLECCYGVNRGWLLTGEGSMVVGSKGHMGDTGGAEVIELVSGFGRLSKDGRKKLIEMLGIMLLTDSEEKGGA